MARMLFTDDLTIREVPEDQVQKFERQDALRVSQDDTVPVVTRDRTIQPIAIGQYRSAVTSGQVMPYTQSVRQQLEQLPKAAPSAKPDSTESFVRNTLAANSTVPFAKRFLEPENYPSVDNRDGSTSSHLMSDGSFTDPETGQERYIAFPTLVLGPGGQQLVAPADQGLNPMREAVRTGNFIEFEDAADANRFASKASSVMFANAKTVANPVQQSVADVAPIQWVGRPLSMERLASLKGGSDYVQLAEKVKKGRAGFWEQVNFFNAESLPFVGMAKEAIDTGIILKTIKDLEAGREVTDQEILDLNMYLLESERDSNLGIGGTVGSIIRQSFSFGGEIAITGLLAAATGGAGLAAGGGAVGAHTTKAAAKAGIKGALKRYLARMARMAGKKAFAKTPMLLAGKNTARGVALKTLDWAGFAAFGGGLGAALSQGVQGITSAASGQGFQTERANVRQISQALTGETEPYWQSLVRSAASDWIERSSEYMGAGVMAALGKTPFIAPLAKRLRSNIFDSAKTVWAKSGAQAVTNRAKEGVSKTGVAIAAMEVMKHFGLDHAGAVQWLQRFGYDGIAEEFAEERIAGFMHGLFGTEGDEAGLRAAFNGAIPTGEQAIAELIAFSLPMAAVDGIQKVEQIALGTVNKDLTQLYDRGIELFNPETRDVQRAPTEAEKKRFEEAGKPVPETITEKEVVALESREELDKIGDDVADLVATMEAAEKVSRPASRTLGFLTDLFIAVQHPFTFDYKRLMYGTADRMAMYNGQIAYLRHYATNRDNNIEQGRTEEEADADARAALKGFVERVYRRTISLPSKGEAGAESALEEAQRLVDEGKAEIIRDPEPGTPVRIRFFEHAQPSDMLRQELANRNIAPEWMSTKDAQDPNKMFTLDAQEFLDKADIKNASSQDLADMMTIFGLADPLSKDSFKQLERRVQMVRNIVEREGSVLHIGSRIDNVEQGVIDYVTEIAPNGAVVTDLGLRLEAHQIGEDRPWRVSKRVDLRLASGIIVTDTKDNLRKFIKENGYEGEADDLLRDARKVEVNGRTKYQLTAGAVTALNGEAFFFDINRGPWHALEDYMEAIRRISQKGQSVLPAELRPYMDQLENYVKSSRDSTKDTAEKAKWESLAKQLSSEKGRFELYHKIVGQKMLQFDQFTLEKLPFQAQIALLPNNLDVAMGQGAMEAIKEDMNDLLGQGWEGAFVNPYSGVRPTLEAQEGVAPAESKQVVSDKAKELQDKKPRPRTSEKTEEPVGPLRDAEAPLEKKTPAAPKAETPAAPKAETPAAPERDFEAEAAKLPPRGERLDAPLGELGSVVSPGEASQLDQLRDELTEQESAAQEEPTGEVETPEQGEPTGTTPEGDQTFEPVSSTVEAPLLAPLTEEEQQAAIERAATGVTEEQEKRIEELGSSLAEDLLTDNDPSEDDLSFSLASDPDTIARDAATIDYLVSVWTTRPEYAARIVRREGDSDEEHSKRIRASLRSWLNGIKMVTPTMLSNYAHVKKMGLEAYQDELRRREAEADTSPSEAQARVADVQAPDLTDTSAQSDEDIESLMDQATDPDANFNDREMAQQRIYERQHSVILSVVADLKGGNTVEAYRVMRNIFHGGSAASAGVLARIIEIVNRNENLEDIPVYDADAFQKWYESDSGTSDEKLVKQLFSLMPYGDAYNAFRYFTGTVRYEAIRSETYEGIDGKDHRMVVAANRQDRTEEYNHLAEGAAAQMTRVTRWKPGAVPHLGAQDYSVTIKKLREDYAKVKNNKEKLAGFLETLTNIPAERWLHALNNETKNNLDPVRSVRFALNAHLGKKDSIRKQFRRAMKPLGRRATALEARQQEEDFFAWRDRFYNDVFIGVNQFVTRFTKTSDGQTKAEQGVETNRSVLYKLARQHDLSSIGELESATKLPGSNTLAPLNAQMTGSYMALYEAWARGEEILETDKPFTIGLYLGEMNLINIRGKNADKMSEEDKRDVWEKMFEDSGRQRMPIIIRSGEKPRFSYIMVKADPSKSYEENYAELEPRVAALAQGDESYWADPVKRQIRSGTFMSPGLPVLPRRDGLQGRVRFAVFRDEALDGGPEADGGSYVIDVGPQQAISEGSADPDSKHGSKTTLTGLYNGKPFLIKSFMKYAKDIDINGNDIEARVIRAVRAYNEAHPEAPITHITSHESQKVESIPVSTLDNLQPVELPVTMMREQQNLNQPTKLKPVNLAIQITSDFQGFQGDAAYLKALSSYAVPFTEDAREKLEAAAWRQSLPEEMFDLQGLLDAGLPDFYPLLTPAADTLKAALTYRTIKVKGNGYSAIAAPASGNQFATAGEVITIDDGTTRYRAPLVITRPENIKGDEARYSEGFESLLAEDGESIDFDAVLVHMTSRWSDGELSDLLVPDAKGKLPARGTILKKENIRYWELRVMELEGRNKVVIPGSRVLVNQSPGSDLSSHPMARLSFEPDASYGNFVKLHQDHVGRAGRDFDGDKWTVFFYRADKEGKIPRSSDSHSGRYNQFLDSIFALFDNYTPEMAASETDPDYYKNKYPEFDALVKEELDKLRKLDPKEVGTQERYREQLQGVRQLIGPFVANVFSYKHGFLGAGVHFRPMATPLQLMPAEEGKPELLWNRFSGMNEERLVHEEFIRRTIARLVNMIIDNAKNPQMSALGLQRKNIGLFFMALVGTQTVTNEEDFDRLFFRIFEWLRSPAVTEYTRILEDADSVFSSGRVSPRELRRQLSDKSKGFSKAEVDAIMKLHNAYQEWFTISSFIRAWAQPIKGGYASFKKLISAREEVAGNKFTHFVADGLLNSPSGQISNAWLGVYEESIWNNDHPFATPYAQKLFGLTRKNRKKGSQDKKFYNDLLTSTMVMALSRPGSKNPHWREEFKDPSKLPGVLHELLEEAYRLQPNNKFLQLLGPQGKIKLGLDIDQVANLTPGVLAGIRADAGRLPAVNDWTGRQLQHALLLYGVWRYGAGRTSSGGSYVNYLDPGKVHRDAWYLVRDELDNVWRNKERSPVQSEKLGLIPFLQHNYVLPEDLRDLAADTEFRRELMTKRLYASLRPVKAIKEAPEVAPEDQGGNWRALSSYKGKIVAYTKLTDAEGNRVAARYHRKRDRILIDPQGMEAAYDRYGKGEYRLHGITPVPGLSTLEKFADFALEHEYQHSRFPQDEGESTVDYENRINRETIKALGLEREQATSPEPATDTGEQIQEPLVPAEPAAQVEAEPVDIDAAFEDAAAEDEAAEEFFEEEQPVAVDEAAITEGVRESPTLNTETPPAPPAPVPSAKTPTEAVAAAPQPPLSDVQIELGFGKTAQATVEQAEALDKLDGFLQSNQPLFVLEGYAGTGKTALVRSALKGYQGAILLAAPTHKARIVLNTSVGVNRNIVGSTTVTKLTGKVFDPSQGGFRSGGKQQRKQKKSVWDGVDLVVIDEASMIHEENLQLILNNARTKGAQVIFMGDPQQLPPVRTSKSQYAGQPAPVFTQFSNKHTLTSVVRQGAGNPLLALASVLRGIGGISEAERRKVTEVVESGEGVKYYRNEGKFADAATKAFREADDTTAVKVVTFTNKARGRWAVLVRKTLHPDSEEGSYAPGMLVTGYDNVTDGPDAFQVVNSADYVIDNVSAPMRNSYGFLGRYIGLTPVDTKNDPMQISKPRIFLVDSSEHERYEKEFNRLLEQAQKNKFTPQAKRYWAEYYAFIGQTMSDRAVAASQAVASNALTSIRQQLAEEEARLADPKTRDKMSETERLRSEIVVQELKFSEDDILKQNVQARAPTIQTGYVITTHKAQGSTYNEVFVDENDMNVNRDRTTRRQLKYTAVTRARNTAHVLSNQSESEAGEATFSLAASAEPLVPEDRVPGTLNTQAEHDARAEELMARGYPQPMAELLAGVTGNPLTRVSEHVYLRDMGIAEEDAQEILDTFEQRPPLRIPTHRKAVSSAAFNAARAEAKRQGKDESQFQPFYGPFQERWTRVREDIEGVDPLQRPAYIERRFADSITSEPYATMLTIAERDLADIKRVEAQNQLAHDLAGKYQTEAPARIEEQLYLGPMAPGYDQRLPGADAPTRQGVEELTLSLGYASEGMRLWLESMNIGSTSLMHNMLMRELMDLDARRTAETAYQTRIGRILGIGTDGELLAMTGKLKKRLAKLTNEDLEMIEQYLWLIPAIREHAHPQTGVRSVENIMRTGKLDSAKRQEIEKLFDQIRITWGSPIKNEKGETVASEQETVTDFFKRWNNSNALAKLTEHRTPTELREVDWFKMLQDLRQFYETAPEEMQRQFAYVQHIYGRGYISRWRQEHSIDKVEKALRKLTNPRAEDTHFAQSPGHKEFERDFTKDPPPATAAQKALYTQLTGETDLDNLTIWDLNAMLARALFDRQEALAQEADYDSATPENQRDLATYRKIVETIKHYRFKEWTAREFPRKFQGSYDSIYRQTAAEFEKFKAAAKELGMKPSALRQRVLAEPEAFSPEVVRAARLSAPYRPRTMNVLNLRQQYVGSIASATMNRTLMRQFTLMADIDGAPMVIAVPSKFVDEKPLLPEPVLQMMASKLAAYHGKQFDPKQDTRGQIVALETEHISDDQYDKLPSPFPSISHFRVLKGDASRVIKHVIQSERKLVVGGYDLLRGWSRSVQWSKRMSVGFSVFFPTTIMESVIAGTGLAKNILFYDVAKGRRVWIPGAAVVSNIKAVRKIANGLTTGDPDLGRMVAQYAREGVQLGFSATADVRGQVERDIEHMAERARIIWGPQWEGRVRGFWQVVTNKWLTDKFFGSPGKQVGLFTAMKVWAASREVARLAEADGYVWEELGEAEQSEYIKRAAPQINDAYGGQFWSRYIWATPQMRQLLNGLMFSPNWTISAFNVAGGGMVTGQVLGNYMGPDNVSYWKQNWPAMVGIVMLGLPTALQATIFALGAAAGGLDDDDKPFPFLNEEGRRTYVDVTPIARLSPWYKGDPTGKRRVYMRWGKQAYEVLNGWVTEPFNQFLRKLSQPAKIVLEQVTGRSPGSDWNLEFQGQGLKGWLFTENASVTAGVLNSRVGMVAQKFIPMSFLNWAKNPETALAGFVAPTSKGMSAGRATAELIVILNSYANTANWVDVAQYALGRKRLESLAHGTLEAARVNGYDVDKIISSAKGVVLGRLYKEFYNAMNKEDTKTMDRMARAILRVGGTIRGITKSAKARASGSNKPFTDEMERAITDAFGGREHVPFND